MTTISEGKKWLRMVLGIQANRLTEYFYYDCDMELFFSIHFCDYFLVNEKLELDTNARSNYSEIELDLLLHWMKRVDVKDESIIPIVQKGLVGFEAIDAEIEILVKEHAINLDTVKVWKVGEETSVTVDVNETNQPKEEKANDQTKKWWEFWK